MIKLTQHLLLRQSSASVAPPIVEYSANNSVQMVLHADRNEERSRYYISQIVRGVVVKSMAWGVIVYPTGHPIKDFITDEAVHGEILELFTQLCKGLFELNVNLLDDWILLGDAYVDESIILASMLWEAEQLNLLGMSKMLGLIEAEEIDESIATLPPMPKDFMTALEEEPNLDEETWGFIHTLDISEENDDD